MRIIVIDRLLAEQNEIVSAVGALVYVGGAWGKAAIYAAIMAAVLLINHESGHYDAGVRGGNLRQAIQEPITKRIALTIKASLSIGLHTLLLARATAPMIATRSRMPVISNAIR